MGRRARVNEFLLSFRQQDLLAAKVGDLARQQVVLFRVAHEIRSLESLVKWYNRYISRGKHDLNVPGQD